MLYKTVLGYFLIEKYINYIITFFISISVSLNNESIYLSIYLSSIYL